MNQRENALTTLSIIQQLATSSSRTDKEQIIFRAVMAGETEFFLGLRLALDPLVTFDLTKVAEIIEDDGEPGDFSFADFLTLAHDLWRRKMTEAEARAAINNAAERCHTATWNLFYRRILLKQLNIGLQPKTINKVLNKLVTAYPQAHDYLVPIIGCQLPHDGSAPLHQRRLKGRKRIDTKLDGIRAITILDTEAQSVNLFTETGKKLTAPGLQDALSGLLGQLPGSVALDGMLVSPQGAVPNLHRKESHLDNDTIKYALFDILPLADFRVGFCPMPQQQRHAMLATIQECGLWRTTNGRVYVVPQIEVDLDTQSGRATLAEFSHQAVALGYKAIMIKDPDAPYNMKRSTAWLQVPTGLQPW